MLWSFFFDYISAFSLRNYTYMAGCIICGARRGVTKWQGQRQDENYIKIDHDDD